MMNSWFGGSSKDDDEKKKEKKQQGGGDGFPGAVAVGPNETGKKQQQAEEESDIPLITDAVVVRAEDLETPSPASYKPAPPMKSSHTMMAPPQTQTPMINSNNMMVPCQPGHLTKPTSAAFYNLGRMPVGLQCPQCKRQTITVVQDRMGVTTVIAIVVIALFFWPLCWLPLCIPSCKATNHYCGHHECRAKLGETSVCA